MNDSARIGQEKSYLLWGFGGGLLDSLISFPYKILVGQRQLPEYLFVSPQEGYLVLGSFLALAIIIGPFLEELIFRFFLYRKIKEKFNKPLAYIISTGLFVIGHKWTEQGTLLLLIMSSLLFTYVYDKTNSLKAAFIAHSFGNLTWFATIYIWKINFT